MKRNIIHILWMAAVLLTACTQEDLTQPDAGNAMPLSITVSDGGYASAGKQTRAAENGYRTEFTAGDACGLFVVRNGEHIFYNIKLTAEEGPDRSLAWVPESSVKLSGGLDGESYFLYYPYTENISLRLSASDVSTDENFFWWLIYGWIPKYDQSDYADYTAADLMTAKGTAATGADGALHLSFNMTHRMALTVIELPRLTYKYEGTDIPDFTSTCSAEAEFSSVSKPCRMADGTYRLLVNPALRARDISLKGGFANGAYLFEISNDGHTACSYKTYRVDGGKSTALPCEAHLSEGDYLCRADDLKGWFIVPKEEYAAVRNPVGVVFHKGANNRDYMDPQIVGGTIHGYAVALTDAGSNLRWAWRQSDGAYSQTVGTFYRDWNGYVDYLRTVRFSEVNPDTWPLVNFEASLKCRLYGEVGCEEWQHRYSAPSNTSGWYLPTVYQLQYIYSYNKNTNPNVLEESIERISHIDPDHIGWFNTRRPYWSSNEYDNENAWCYYFGARDIMIEKSASILARPIITF